MGGSSSENLRFLPVGLDVRGKRCLVVGGGSVGSRKVNNLLRAGAAVTVVSPAVTQALATHARSGRINWTASRFSEGHLEGFMLVVVATDDEDLNSQIVTNASDRGMLVCDASSAERTQLIFGALHQSGDGATIAVFTDGRDPSQARRTRDRIASFLDQDSKQESRPE